MHVLDDSALFQTLPSQSLKENNGKGARRSLLKKMYILTIVSVALFSIYILFSGKALEAIRNRKASLKLRRGSSNNNSNFISDVNQKEQNNDNNEEGKLIVFKISNLDGDNSKDGTFIVRTKPSWAPLGVRRFEALVSDKFFDGCRFFRVVKNFVVQFGINGDPAVNEEWDKVIKDDEVLMTNKRGTVVFATSGKNTRTTQMFINTGKKNAYLDKQGFSPVGIVIEGMDIVDHIYGGYGEEPKQWKIEEQGNSYLESDFPKLSYISTAAFK